MEPLAPSTHLGYREELVEGVWDLFHQVQQLQISIPSGPRRDEPRVKEQAEQQGSAGADRSPHPLGIASDTPTRRDRRPESASASQPPQRRARRKIWTQHPGYAVKIRVS